MRYSRWKLNETFSHLVYVCVNLICTDKKISQACKRASFPDFDALEAQQSNPPIKVKWSIDTFPYMKKCLKPVHKEKKLNIPRRGGSTRSIPYTVFLVLRKFTCARRNVQSNVNFDQQVIYVIIQNNDS